MTLRHTIIFCCLTITLIAGACNKLVTVDEPVTTITTAEVFSTNDQAVSAMVGIYSKMINFDLQFASGAITINCGLSSDELNTVFQSYTDLVTFQTNNLKSSNSIVLDQLWQPAYSYIYAANAIIGGLTSVSGVDDSTRKELMGEAKFVRAFCYFYLVNLFGDIPLVTTIDYNKTSLLSRTPSPLVYQQIVQDLIDAQGLLPNDYSVSNGERIRPNSWAATALLSRTYLYMGKWSDAETQATRIIQNTGTYQLTSDLRNVFSANSTESIWQLKQNNTICCAFNATTEGIYLVTPDSFSNPQYFITPQLLNAFDSGDQRKFAWIDSSNFDNTEFYFPYKYTIGPSQTAPNGPIPQYYMMLRLAEQYLIRAEARMEQNKTADAINDLNVVRSRAGLPNTTATDKNSILAAILHERQIELFAEWGHRWLDLKRTSQATAILGPIKPLWNQNAQLYPLPLTELIVDPNLVQNNGY